jgi:hypothetical protein
VLDVAVENTYIEIVYVSEGASELRSFRVHSPSEVEIYQSADQSEVTSLPLESII